MIKSAGRREARTMTSITINVSYDSSVTALQTSNPTLYTDYTTAVQTAVQYYESIITNPITVTIRFGWGEVGGASIDAGSAVASLPTTDPTKGESLVI